MSEPKILIDCRDAALGYEGRPIWEHLSFRVRRGDYLCIVGDNGSGKQKDKHLKWMLVLLYPMYYVKMCSRCSILLSHSLLESAHSFSSVSISVFIGRFFL